MGLLHLEYFRVEADNPMTDENKPTTVENPADGNNMAENRRSGIDWFANLPIGYKLGLGFGILVFLVFIGAVVSFTTSNIANTQVVRTEKIRVPTSLLASDAQANLLRMQADVRGYLALGDQKYRDLYTQDTQTFVKNLEDLEAIGPDLGQVSQIYLKQLRQSFEQWAVLPDQLFELRDDQLDREPAYRLLATDGISYAGEVLIAINQMIETQGKREPTSQNMEILGDMAKFQGEFSAMLSALRGYVTTRNRIYRGEYEVNLASNNNSWERLQKDLNNLSDSQKEQLSTIEENRAKFLGLPDQIFTILASDHWREDLYLFQNQAIPLSNDMLKQLTALTSDQQERLTSELGAGRRSLSTANTLILASGFAALIISLLMALLSRSTIAQPIRRLTNVAEQIRGGDLEAQALVESKDEIGSLASTFNRMTAQLRATLFQVRKEKKRADDLLEVVIPIGVELTTERDFNRLLEKMLIEAKTFCKADAGLLLLAAADSDHPDEKNLRYAIIRNDSQGRFLGGTTGTTMPFATLPLSIDGAPNHSHLAAHIALTGETVNITDLEDAGPAYADFRTAFSKDVALADYSIHSLLGIPLKSMEKADQAIVNGVMLLLNAQDVEKGGITVFDPNLQQMMESFSSLAVAALEAYIREQTLRAEVAQLRIEIDKVKQLKAVEEIVETDFFRDLQAKARSMRIRRRGGSESTP
jgi:CHASE3 domain sensor protein